MVYGTRDLNTEERNAWQRGDYVLADTLGALIDAENSENRVTELSNVLDDLRDEIVRASWRTDKKAELRDLVQRISVKLAEAV